MTWRRTCKGGKECRRGCGGEGDPGCIEVKFCFFLLCIRMCLFVLFSAADLGKSLCRRRIIFLLKALYFSLFA